MCWRNHDPKRRGKWHACLDCHAIHMRLTRKGAKIRHMPRYRMRVNQFKRYAVRRSPIIAQLSDVSLNTLHEYVYRGRGASLSVAQSIADAMCMKLDELWTQV